MKICGEKWPLEGSSICISIQSIPYQGLLIRNFLQVGSACCSYFNNTFCTAVVGDLYLDVPLTASILLFQGSNLSTHTQDCRSHPDVLEGQKIVCIWESREMLLSLCPEENVHSWNIFSCCKLHTDWGKESTCLITISKGPRVLSIWFPDYCYLRKLLWHSKVNKPTFSCYICTQFHDQYFFAIVLLLWIAIMFIANWHS